jgi:hypothetical protein
MLCGNHGLYRNGATFGGAFLPSQLFGATDQGVWYDPSDYSTLFQDSLGVTPVTSVEQPVGRILDKRIDVKRGANLVTNGTFGSLTGWTDASSAGGSINATGNKLNIVHAGGTARANFPITFTIGKWYELVWEQEGTGLNVYSNDATESLGGLANTGINRRLFCASSLSTSLNFRNFQTNTTISVDNVSIREVLDTSVFNDNCSTLTNWTNIIGFASLVNGRIRVARPADNNIGRVSAPFNCEIGKTYRVMMERYPGTTSTGSTSIAIAIGFASVGGALIDNTSTTVGTFSFYFTATQTTHWLFLQTPNGANIGEYCDFDNILITEATGNHAVQPTSTSRPTLRARYNQLVYSEDLTNNTWAKSDMVITSNTHVAPDGTLTADTVTQGVTNGGLLSQLSTIAVNKTYRLTAHYKKIAGQASFLRIMVLETANSSNQVRLWVNLDTGVISGGASAGTGFTYIGANITALDNGYYRVSLDFASATATAISCAVVTADAMGSTNRQSNTSFVMWGADLRPIELTLNVPIYQRTRLVTDYDTVGFPFYLEADGVDDWMITNTINLSSSDKATSVVGMRKNSDVASGLLYEIGIGAQNGSFSILAPGSTLNNIIAILRGTINVFPGFSSTAPQTNVVSIIQNISGDIGTIRQNGVERSTQTLDQGTGNLGNYPLYLFRRSGTSLPFNGRMYGLVIINKLLSATELTNLENFINNQTKAY